MSSHDKGAFGQLLARLYELGYPNITFNLMQDSLDEGRRWCVWENENLYKLDKTFAYGRTGEEALRKLVDLIEKEIEPHE